MSSSVRERSRDLASFCNCEETLAEVKGRPRTAGWTAPQTALRLTRQRTQDIMDEIVPKSCWGVAAKAVAGFAFIILLAWLIGGAETAAVVAAG